MAGGNKPVVKSIRPTTRDELRQALQEQGFRRTGSDAAQYETWKGPDGVKIDIRPNGEVIRTQRVPRTDGVQENIRNDKIMKAIHCQIIIIILDILSNEKIFFTM
ncbi:hypothetical protein [Neisseria gonorrhoeae]|uniref:hypothetical protein n=1 Tax=Neisseria gonorrhoeae TaxID=485 RepID=UPI00398ECB31